MELSVLVAKIIALTYISAGIAALSGKITFSKIVEDFEKSQGLTFVSGFITLVVGMLLVHYHNIWIKRLDCAYHYYRLGITFKRCYAYSVSAVNRVRGETYGKFGPLY